MALHEKYKGIKQSWQTETNSYVWQRDISYKRRICFRCVKTFIVITIEMIVLILSEHLLSKKEKNPQGSYKNKHLDNWSCLKQDKFVCCGKNAQKHHGHQEIYLTSNNRRANKRLLKSTFTGIVIIVKTKGITARNLLLCLGLFSLLL